MTADRFAVRATAAALGIALAAACAPVSVAPSCADLSDLRVGELPEVRLLVLYSEKAALNSGDIEGVIEAAVEEINVALRLSQVRLQVTLVHMARVALNDNQSNSALRGALTDGTGPLAVAHSLRDEHHADVVALIAEVAGGMGWPMTVPSPTHRDKAFLVAGRIGTGADLDLAHEVGHILGGVHHRPVALPDQPRYRYAYPHICHGCVIDGLTGWRTIMATPTDPYTTRVEYFSNPQVAYGGSLTGVPSTGVDAEDNRKTLTNTASIAASFRITPVWFASAGASGPWFEKRAADEQLANLAFADLDGDGETDAFKVSTQAKKWYISRSASLFWEELNDDASGTALPDLRFADFDGDGAADVFRIDGTTGEWLVSWKGTSGWQVLNSTISTAGVPVTDLAFGYFDGDTKADVFRSDAPSGTWFISPAGQGPWQAVNGPASEFKSPVVDLGFGDFDGDGITDVFRSEVSSQRWFWSKGGSVSWEVLNGPHVDLAVPVAELLLGDFDGDGTTDVLRANGAGWAVAVAGKGPLGLVKLSCVTHVDMAVGDFDGDRSADIIRVGIRP